jgi:peptidoglycan lytic transglycosylase
MYGEISALSILAVAASLLWSHQASAEDSLRVSWYGGSGEKLSARTASGEIFDPRANTAAHRSLPFGTHLEVKYHGRSVVVRVNDRGPAAATGKDLDLSRAAASALGISGSAVVTIRKLD